MKIKIEKSGSQSEIDSIDSEISSPQYFKFTKVGFVVNGTQNEPKETKEEKERKNEKSEKGTEELFKTIIIPLLCKIKEKNYKYCLYKNFWRRYKIN